jgi:hypothetical protein
MIASRAIANVTVAVDLGLSMRTPVPVERFHGEKEKGDDGDYPAVIFMTSSASTE